MGWLRGLVLTTNIISLLVTADISSIIAATNVQHKAKNCTYLVTIETTCTVGAGTSNHVGLRFGDANSNEVLVNHLNSNSVKRVDPLEPQVLDDMSRKPFQACISDRFLVAGQCVESPICFLYLKLAGDDDWRPGLARVRVVDPLKSHLGSGRFYFRRYLPRHVWHGSDSCDPEMTPFGLKHRRKIYREENPKAANSLF